MSQNIIRYVPVSNKIHIESVYADKHHHDNYFTHNAQTLYVQNADFLIHKHLKHILDYAVKNIPDNMCLRLYDGLRPVDAQKIMRNMADKQGFHADLIAAAGQGGHPRGLAIDCALVGKNDGYANVSIDYGCGFDDFTFVDSLSGHHTDSQDLNAIPLAGRNTKFIPFLAKQARLRLEILMQKSALMAGTILMPLPQEWWDFRVPYDETDLKYVLASLNRILFDDYKTIPDVDSYEGFCEYWRQHYDQHLIPIEKRFLIDYQFLCADDFLELEIHESKKIS